MTISKKLQLLFRLARLHFLFPGFMLFLMGYLLAMISGRADFELIKFVFGYFILGISQLSVSFSNDYFDRHADIKSVRTAFSGGSKILVEHPDLEQTALKTSVFLLSLSIMGSALFTVVYQYPLWFFIFVLCGALIGWFYTAPPLNFSYRGLGELVTMLAIGFFIPGMGYFVASGALDYFFYVFGFPLLFYGLFFILTVELPDVDSDAIAQKRNILVKWGTKVGKIICVGVSILGTISLVIILFTGVTAKKFDPTLIAIFSVLPLISSILGINANLDNRDSVNQQVIVNISSLVLFLLLTDVIILLQL